MDILAKRDDSHPGGAERDGLRVHHTIQNSEKCKACLFLEFSN